MNGPDLDAEPTPREQQIIVKLVQAELAEDAEQALHAIRLFADDSDSNALDLEVWDVDSLVHRIGTNARWWDH